MYLSLLKENEKIAFMDLAHVVALTDGFVHEKEEIMLKTYMHEMEIPADYMYTSRDLSQLLCEFTSEQSKNVVFLEILALSLSDGIYHDTEKQMMSEVRQAFAISIAKYEAMKQWIVQINDLYAHGHQLIYG